MSLDTLQDPLSARHPRPPASICSGPEVDRARSTGTSQAARSATSSCRCRSARSPTCRARNRSGVARRAAVPNAEARHGVLSSVADGCGTRACTSRRARVGRARADARPHHRGAQCHRRRVVAIVLIRHDLDTRRRRAGDVLFAHRPSPLPSLGSCKGQHRPGCSRSPGQSRSAPRSGRRGREHRRARRGRRRHRPPSAP